LVATRRIGFAVNEGASADDGKGVKGWTAVFLCCGEYSRYTKKKKKSADLHVYSPDLVVELSLEPKRTTAPKDTRSHPRRNKPLVTPEAKACIFDGAEWHGC
jgi:hypothetical protein